MITGPVALRDGSPGPLVVVGDSLLDVDLTGRATRLCPDAPVPVVDVDAQRCRPGGAGLAALLAAADELPVVLITAVGHDVESELLIDLLGPRVELIALPTRGATATKTRVAAHDVPLLRLDRGSGRAAPGPLPAAVLTAVRGALRRAGAVLVSDYGRGVTGLEDLRTELTTAATRVPVVWDPHPRGAEPVPGCRLVTPNAAEAEHFAGEAEPAAAGAQLVARWQADAVAVTVGERGAVLVDHAADGSIRDTVVPVRPEHPARNGSRLDSCGAGDRFASAATASLRTDPDVAAAVTAAAAEAARFVRAGAAGSISVDVGSDRELASGAAGDPIEDALSLAKRIRRTGGRLVATGGCFDLLHVGHIELLSAARRLGDALVVCLNSDASVRRAKGPERPLVGQADRAKVLAALAAVDAVVIFDEDTPAEILHTLRPDVWVKGNDYADKPMPEESVVQRFGGRVALLPLVTGYSTSSLVRTARRLAPVPDPTDNINLEVS